MLRVLLTCLALVLTLPSARAQQNQRPTMISPPPVSGYGSLAVAAVSIPLSGLVPSPNSGSFPTAALPFNQFAVANEGPSTVYVCLLAGTCTAANGWPLLIGAEHTWFSLNGSTLSPTVISAGTSAIVVSW